MQQEWETISQTENELTQGMIVPGGSLVRIVRKYNIKNNFGESQAVVFIPAGPLTKLKEWFLSLWK